MAMEFKSKGLRLRRSDRTGQDRAFELTFQVRSDTPTNAVSVSAWLVSNIPQTLSAFGGDGFVLKEYRVDAEDPNELMYWSGTAQYELKQSSQGSSSDKTREGTLVDFDTATYEVVVEKALNADGKEVPILNSAGDPFAEPLMEEEDRWVIYIEKTYSWNSINPRTFSQYFNSVNQNNISIADLPVIARGARMRKINPTVRYLGSNSYDWRIRFEIEVKRHGKRFDREVLDRGFSYLEELDDRYPGSFKKGDKWYMRRLVNVQNADTGEYQQAPAPVLLDGNGGLLADTDEPVYLIFRTRPEVNWANLGFPRTIAEVAG